MGLRRHTDLRDAPADVAAFVESLRVAKQSWRGRYRGPSAPFDDTTVVVARAPGRLDVMGGIADYSGSLVLQRPIAEATCVAVQRRDRPVLEIASTSGRAIAVPLATLLPHRRDGPGEPISYEAARAAFPAGTDRHWAAYVVGLFLVLMRERSVTFRGGASIAIDSRVPEGAGVSSSASLETAAMAAIATAFDVRLTADEIALLCQQAENLVAGAPCGVMDQMACVFGEPNAFMTLLCQPAERLDPVPIRDDLAFWGVDSGERHSIGPSTALRASGADYTAVRTGAFMGLRIINSVVSGSNSWVSDSRAVVSGFSRTSNLSTPIDYLANLTPEEFERDFALLLPEEMSGADFLTRFGGTSDTVTRVDPKRSYRVRRPAAHPVFEHHRVSRFRDLMLAGGHESTRREAGELLYQSHASYSACGLGSPATDRLVELVRAEGPAAGLYGARITGGGSGGTVVVLGGRDAEPAIARVVDAYARQTGHRPYVFSGSSPGVASCGVFEVNL